MAPLRLITAASLLLAAVGLARPAAARQETPPPDTAAAPADTVPADTAAADTATGPPPSFPDRLEAGPGRSTARVQRWDREDLLDSSALSLQDFLQDHASGVLPLRAGYFFGPHQLADGPFGPGAVRVVVDGRPLPPLASGQPDLSRVSLAGVQRIELVRRAGETVVEVSTLDHEGEEAYSRISAGTGQPGAEAIRGLFTNGAGDDFAVQAAVDHLNIGAGEMPGNRLDAWARVGWMPLGGETGVELVWRADGVERTMGERSEDFDRGHLLIHARSRLAEGFQAEVWAGGTSREPRPDYFPGSEPPAGDGQDGDGTDGDGTDGGTDDTTPDEGPPPAYEAEQILGSLTYRGERAFLRVSGGSWSGDGLPDATGEVRGSLRLGPVVAEGGAELASWPSVSTIGWSAGLALRPGWWEGTLLRLEAAAGSRAAPRPGRSVGDSLVQDYDAVSVGTGLELGPYRLSGHVARRTVSRQLPFGGFFDRALPVAGEVEVTDVEARLAGPPIPVGFLRDHATVRAFWRRSRTGEETTTYYLPETLARGEGMLRHSFFDENLEIRLVGRVVHRGEMTTARPGEAEPVTLAPETTFGSEVVIRIDTFRIWWRTDNLTGVEQRDFEGLVFPASRNVFGIRWEFFN